MNLYKLFLIVAALLPAVVLCAYVYKKDRVEKEPVSLLLMLLLMGAISCLPIAFIEEFLSVVLDRIFLPFGVLDADGELQVTGGMFYIYNFIMYFLIVALAEEGGKKIILVLKTKNNKNFNSLFDGIIYSVFVSLGFAAFENVGYVFQYGLGNAVMRAVLAVPGHMFYGVMMGYYYTLEHIYEKAAVYEREMKKTGLISPDMPLYNSSRFAHLGLIVPVLAHGLYDYCCTIGSGAAMIVFFGFVIFMYVYCFGKIKKMSKADVSDNSYVAGLLVKKYPFLADSGYAYFNEYSGIR